MADIYHKEDSREFDASVTFKTTKAKKKFLQYLMANSECDTVQEFINAVMDRALDLFAHEAGYDSRDEFLAAYRSHPVTTLDLVGSITVEKTAPKWESEPQADDQAAQHRAKS